MFRESTEKRGNIIDSVVIRIERIIIGAAGDCFHMVCIVRTFGIDTFVYAEELAVFLGNQGIAAMRTGKPDGSGDYFAG